MLPTRPCSWPILSLIPLPPPNLRRPSSPPLFLLWCSLSASLPPPPFRVSLPPPDTLVSTDYRAAERSSHTKQSLSHCCQCMKRVSLCKGLSDFDESIPEVSAVVSSRLSSLYKNNKSCSLSGWSNSSFVHFGLCVCRAVKRDCEKVTQGFDWGQKTIWKSAKSTLGNKNKTATCRWIRPKKINKQRFQTTQTSKIRKRETVVPN